MKRPVIGIKLTLVAVAAGLLQLAGCRDRTQTPENQAATARRQAIIQQHKNDH